MCPAAGEQGEKKAGWGGLLNAPNSNRLQRQAGVVRAAEKVLEDCSLLPNLWQREAGG
jgi:hypothetical protein